MAVQSVSRAEEMEAFYQQIGGKAMEALWRLRAPETTPASARAPYPPHLWRWSDIRPCMDCAAQLVRPGPDAERRVLMLTNPALAPAKSATHTVSAAVQMVLPGEVAPTHRHTMAAVRFVLEGQGAHSYVNGEPCSMQPGDLILNPAWCWNGHVNDSDAPVIWMDSLDVPFVRMLRTSLFEEYPDEMMPATRPVNDSFSRYGGGRLRPVWERCSGPDSPLLSYPWGETERSLLHLARLGEASPYDDVAFQFTNPATGAHVLPTIGCWVQLLRPGVHTRAHRHNTVSVYHVFRGHGSTVVDGVQMDWQQGDFFALPPYAWHEHLNGSTSAEAILFSTNDLPIYEAVHLYREDPYEEHAGFQPVVTSYAERYES